MDFTMSSQSPADLPPPMNHVFVDFENVHQIDLSIVGKKAVSFTLLLGAKQTKLDAELVEKLMENAAAVQLVRLAKSGRNALDFALSYYVGRAAITDPTAYFHIVSKDKGFDPLIEHLRSRHIQARRHDDCSSLTFSAKSKAPAAPSDDLLDVVIKHLSKKTTGKPKTRATLVSTLGTHLGKKANAARVEELVKELFARNFVRLADDKKSLDFHLPAA